MATWWLLLMTRSSRDSATTGLGNSGYQSCGDRFEVRISDFPVRSLISSYRSSAWAAVSSRIAKSSSMRTAGRASSARRLCQVWSAWPPARCGEGAAGFEEAGFGAVADGEVAEGLGDVAFADADGPVEGDGLAGVQPAEGGE